MIKPNVGLAEKSNNADMRKEDIITMAMFTKLRLINKVARSLLGLSISSRIRASVLVLDSFRISRSEGPREKNALSAAEMTVVRQSSRNIPKRAKAMLILLPADWFLFDRGWPYCLPPLLSCNV